MIYSLLLVFRATRSSLHRWRFVREAIAFVAQLSSRGRSPGLQPSKCHGTTGYDDRLPGFSLGMAHQVGMSSVSGRCPGTEDWNEEVKFLLWGWKSRSWRARIDLEICRMNIWNVTQSIINLTNLDLTIANPPVSQHSYGSYGKYPFEINPRVFCSMI